MVGDAAAQTNTGGSDWITQHKSERVLRAPIDGILRIAKKIGNHVLSQEKIAEVDGQPILAPFDGVLRGLLHDGLTVKEGMKVGDVDARGDPQYARLVSEKSLAIAGGVLEALLTRPEIRNSLWS